MAVGMLCCAAANLLRLELLMLLVMLQPCRVGLVGVVSRRWRHGFVPRERVFALCVELSHSKTKRD